MYALGIQEALNVVHKIRASGVKGEVLVAFLTDYLLDQCKDKSKLGDKYAQGYRDGLTQVLEILS